MQKFWIMVGAEFKEPVRVTDTNKVAKGFYQNFGATFLSKDETIERLEKIASKQNASIFKIEVRENIVFNDLSAAIKKECSNPDELGIWYMSGKIYYY